MPYDATLLVVASGDRSYDWRVLDELSDEMVNIDFCVIIAIVY